MAWNSSVFTQSEVLNFISRLVLLQVLFLYVTKVLAPISCLG